MLVWTDLETTGLDADKERILEIAVVITDDDFNEITNLQRVVYYEHAATIVEELDRQRKLAGGDLTSGHYVDARSNLRSLTGQGIDIHPVVLEMHDKNGLWKDCVHGIALDTIDREVAYLVKCHAVRLETEIVNNGDGPPTYKNKLVTPQLAGSTISFDRAFIKKYMPRFSDEKILHYRNLDVSSFNEMSKRDPALKLVYEKRPRNETKAHRGLADIQESIAGAKHYRNAFSRAVSAFAVSGAIEGLVAP